MGVMGFLHTEGLRSMSLGRWEGVPGGRGSRARNTDTILQGEQPQGPVRRVRSAGQGADGRGREGSLPSLRQCLQDGVHFLGHSRQCKLKLVLQEHSRRREGPCHLSPRAYVC